MASSSIRDRVELRDGLEIIVSEVFGPTVQGEGTTLGKPTMFLRLGICNLSCTWCDTRYTWDWKNYDYTEEVKRVTSEGVVEEILEKASGNKFVNRLVISGGEPLLQQYKLGYVLDVLVDNLGWNVEIETAGTIAPSKIMKELVSQFNVSPKLEHSGNPKDKRFKPAVLREFKDTNKAVFKFVAKNVEDLNEVESIVSLVGIPESLVYIMPEGQDPETISTRACALVDDVIAKGYNLTTRLHVLLWGSKRGV